MGYRLPSSRKINSNDFGLFWNYVADSNSNFVVMDFFQNSSIFLCVRGSIACTM